MEVHQKLLLRGGATPLMRKLLLIMKMTVVLLLFACLHSYAEGFAQRRITLRLESADMKQALQQIEKRSNYRFLYNQAVLKNAGRISINVNNELLENVLNAIFKGTGISYRMLDGELIVLSTAADEEVEVPAPQQLKGRVTDVDGKPIPGASVIIKGTKTGTAADADGNFSITVEENAVLVISAVGYATQEVAVAGKSSLEIAMVANATSGLNEVVVIGYGTASRRDLTGSIVKIGGKEVADKPNPNPVASLQGRVAGLSVVNNGTPGAEPDIRIRGTGSINGVRPLYVVDGIFQDNINYLNPNDIESIEVLKDPSSLAIFGVRGANGVIAITTKRGKGAGVTVNFNTNLGFKILTDRIEMVNAEEFKILFDEEQANIGVPVNQRFDYSKWTGNTDWIDVMTRTATFSNSNLSINSSTEKNKFYMGLGYTVDQGVIKHQQLQRMLLNISDELKVSKNIKLGFTLNYSRDRAPFSQANGLLFDARRVLPITPVMDPTNTYFTELAIQAAQMSNPLMNLENKWDKELTFENRYLGSVYADITFLKKFNWRSTFYADQSNVDSRSYNPIILTFNPALGQNGTVFTDRNNRQTSVNQSNQRWNKYQQDHVLTYKNSFGDHNVTASAGFTTFFNNYVGLFASVRQSATGEPIPNDKRFWYVDNGFGDASTRRASSSQWERATVSGLVRVLYNYQNKYYLNGSFRRDGSSQISPNNRFQNFYSVGAAWEMTREKFMEPVKFVDFLKLKGSYGVLGSQNVPGNNPYPFYPGLITGNTAVFGTIIAPAYSQAYVPNPKLRWEQVAAYEFGFEANLLRNRLHVEAAWYDRTTSDILSEQRVAGASQPTLNNVAKMRNRGLELTASWTQQFSKDLTLTVGGNLTTFSNKVITAEKLVASEERPNQTEAGFPIGYFYGYVVEGVYQSYADKLASPTVIGYEYGPGDLKYKDINGDGRIDASDRTMIGNPTPDFAYGLNANLRYKGFELGVDLNGVYGNEIYRYWGSSELPFTTFNYPKFKLNRWNGPGTSNWDPALGANRAINRLPSTYGIEDGSYLRIRNIQAAYNFSLRSQNKLQIRTLRVFANAQNPITWARNSGYTPEFGGSATSFGIDNGDNPLPMVVTFGVNVTFQ
jgi:TonB-linked SusC/RagA family outer membrane protein